MYLVLISVGVNIGTQRTVTSVLDTGANQPLFNSLSLPPNWRSYVKPFNAPEFRTATK